MLTIKLAKVGKKNKKMFRVIISEKSKDPYGKALEILGSYNPYSKELKVKENRVKHWLSKGSSMTPSVNNLFIDNQIIKGTKLKNSQAGTPNKRKTEKAEKQKQKLEAELSSKEENLETPQEAPVETSEKKEVKTEEGKEEVKKEAPEEAPKELKAEDSSEKKETSEPKPEA